MATNYFSRKPLNALFEGCFVSGEANFFQILSESRSSERAKRGRPPSQPPPFAGAQRPRGAPGVRGSGSAGRTTGDSGATSRHQRCARTKPARSAASVESNQTSVIVRSYPPEPCRWYFIERSLPLITNPCGGSAPTYDPSP